MADMVPFNREGKKFLLLKVFVITIVLGILFICRKEQYFVSIIMKCII